MAPLKVFVGVDSRQPIAYTVCRHSIERNARQRVSVEPIRIDWTPITRVGLTQFSFARYAVPWLCGYAGTAIFMDADILVTGDVNELISLADPQIPVSVVKGSKRFEWPSVMVFNNYLCRVLTPEFINDEHSEVHTLNWADPVGNLPAEWNFCCGYDQVPRETPKLIHFTAGLPCFPETQGSPYADLWEKELQMAVGTVSWKELMGNSVHRELVQSGALA